MAKPAILLSPRFYRSLKNMSDGDITQVEMALQLVPECFGRPHIRAGISIRRLKKNIFECRAGLQIRLLFRQKAGALEFFFAGNHDEVRRIIQDL